MCYLTLHDYPSLGEGENYGILLLLFYLFYWLRLLLIVCGDIESNLGTGSDRRVRALYYNICGLDANLDELAVAGSDYDVLVCGESKVSDRRHLSELRIHGFGCPQQRLRNSTPGAHGMALYVREGFRSFGRASWSVLATSLVCFVFGEG